MNVVNSSHVKYAVKRVLNKAIGNNELTILRGDTNTSLRMTDGSTKEIFFDAVLEIIGNVQNVQSSAPLGKVYKIKKGEARWIESETWKHL